MWDAHTYGFALPLHTQGVKYVCVAGRAVRGNKEADRRTLRCAAISCYWKFAASSCCDQLLLPACMLRVSCASARRSVDSRSGGRLTAAVPFSGTPTSRGGKVAGWLPVRSVTTVH